MARALEEVLGDQDNGERGRDARQRNERERAHGAGNAHSKIEGAKRQQAAERGKDEAAGDAAESYAGAANQADETGRGMEVAAAAAHES